MVETAPSKAHAHNEMTYSGKLRMTIETEACEIRLAPGDEKHELTSVPLSNTVNILESVCNILGGIRNLLVCVSVLFIHQVLPLRMNRRVFEPEGSQILNDKFREMSPCTAIRHTGSTFLYTLRTRPSTTANSVSWGIPGEPGWLCILRDFALVQRRSS